MPTSEDSEEVTFFDALYAKFCDDTPAEEIELPQTNGVKRVCQYVGFDQLQESLRNVVQLPVINLAMMNISTCGHVDFDRFQLLKVKSLDLSLNRLSSWQMVCQIVSCTERLLELVLTGNPLLVPQQEEIQSMGDTLCCLRTIVLGNLSYNWNDILQCAILWPNIERLMLFRNTISVLCSPPADWWHNLKFINLNENPISDWAEICKLGTLPKLETIELTDCQIECINFDKVDDKQSNNTKLFPELKYLDLTKNKIADWRSIAQLSRLTKLQYLRLKHNPVYADKPYSHNFNYVVARLASLRTLDREPVTQKIRDDSEKYYLRTIYSQYLTVQHDVNLRKQFLEENPYFIDILHKLGEPVIAKVLTKEEKIKQNYLKLTIIDETNPDKVIHKQVPISLKVSNLKLILRRLLNIDMNQDFSLIIISPGYEEEMLDRDDVSTYRVEPGHTIRVKRL